MSTQTRERLIAYALQLPNWFNSFIFCSSGIELHELMITPSFFFYHLCTSGRKFDDFCIVKADNPTELSERKAQPASK